MELQGEQFIPQVQDKVWQALNDPEILRACINGCESIEAVSDEEYKVVVAASVGPVKARFNGKLVLRDVVAPDSYALTFQGNGGAAGFGKGDASVKLATEPGGTRLSYAVKVQVGGKLAQIGSRLIDGVGRKIAEDFFTAFNERVGEPPSVDASNDAPVAAPEPVAAAGVAGAAHQARQHEQSRRPGALASSWRWGAAAIAAVVVIGIIVAYGH
jgi:carbon monoxide dehydrogenase subunit G